MEVGRARRRARRGAVDPPVTVVVPAFDEAETVGPLGRRLRAVGPTHQIVVVDDGSRDGTGSRALAAGAEVVTHRFRRGNGAAVKSGLAAARAPVVAIVDGDGQHDPAALPRLVAELEDGADLVVARRTDFAGSGACRRLGNRLLSALASFMARHPVPDLTSGYRVFRVDAVRPFVPLLPEGFSTPTTTTMACLHHGRRVRFVPVGARPRRRTSSTRTRLVRDGLTVLFKVTLLFRPWRALGPVVAGSALGLWLASRAGVSWLGLGAGLLGGATAAVGLLVADGFRWLRRPPPRGDRVAASGGRAVVVAGEPIAAEASVD